MKAVGVRELKARLSAYLRDVVGGETVLITDRGRVIAELRAPSDQASPESDIDRRLRNLASLVPLTIGRRRPGYMYPAAPISTPAPDGTAQRLIDRDRDDSSRLR